MRLAWRLMALAFFALAVWTLAPIVDVLFRLFLASLALLGALWSLAQAWEA